PVTAATSGRTGARTLRESPTTAGSRCGWSFRDGAVLDAVDENPSELSGQTLFHILDPVRNVADALFLGADLALDAQWPAIADFLQRLNKLLDVGLTLAQRHFLTPGAGDLRPVGVLDVDAANVGAENLDGAQGVALVVKDHVGGIEVDLEVRALQVV